MKQLVPAVLLCLTACTSPVQAPPAPPAEAFSSPTPSTAPEPTDVAAPTDETADSSLAPMPPPPPSARRARVVHVTDGDTVVLRGIEHGEVHAATGGRKARFIGIDTPEVFGGGECYGALASAFTRKALDGEKVLVDFDVDITDRYGRALVYLWESDGTFFNGRLVREGFAFQMTVPPNVRYAELFTTLAREARKAERGLWSGCRLDAPAI